MTPFDRVRTTAAERAQPRAGDDLVPDVDVVMDRAFTVPGTPDEIWPWLVQLGKGRAGWYLPRSLERFIPPRRRAARSIDPRWQTLGVGDVIPDYGGRHETFTVAQISPPTTLVHRSTRGRMHVSWSIALRPAGDAPAGDAPPRDAPPADAPPGATGARTRVLFRLRLGPVKRRWLVNTGGGFIDLLTIAGLAAGLRERLRQP